MDKDNNTNTNMNKNTHTHTGMGLGMHAHMPMRALPRSLQALILDHREGRQTQTAHDMDGDPGFLVNGAPLGGSLVIRGGALVRQAPPKPPDHYATLGVSWGALGKEMKTAYKQKALKAHPDKGGNPEAFKTLLTAYETLTDPGRRAAYDALVLRWQASRGGPAAGPGSSSSSSRGSGHHASTPPAKGSGKTTPAAASSSGASGRSGCRMAAAMMDIITSRSSVVAGLEPATTPVQTTTSRDRASLIRNRRGILRHPRERRRIHMEERPRRSPRT